MIKNIKIKSNELKDINNKELVKYLLNLDNCYDIFISFSTIKFIIIDSFGNINNNITMKKGELKEYLIKIDKDSELLKKERKNLNKIKKDDISKLFKENKKYKTSNYYYNEKYYKGSISNLLLLINLESNCFNNLLNQEKILGLPKEQFFVMIFSLYDSLNSILSDYWLKDYQINNINTLLNYSLSYPVFHKIELNKNPEYLKKVTLNKELYHEIMNDIPENFNKIEKSFYIYLKLCSILRYDKEYLIPTENYEFIKNHQKLERIPKINRDNNIVLCYEFEAIYAKFLEQIGIDFSLNTDKDFGKEHPDISINYKNSLIHVDAVNGLIDSDLVSIYNEMPAFDFKILAANPNTREEIYNSMQNVYDYLKEIENKKYYDEEQLNLLYDIDKLNVNEKMKLFLKLVINTNLKDINKLKYCATIRRMINCKNIDNRYISIKINDKKELGSIIIFNKKQIRITEKNDNVYLLITDNLIQFISKDFIEEKIKNKDIQCLNFYHQTIPGISDDCYMSLILEDIDEDIELIKRGRNK